LLIKNLIYTLDNYMISLDAKIEDIVFSFIDVETTGLNPDVDRICEIALVSYKDFKQIYSFSTLINPQKYIPFEATKVNKITNEMVKNSPTFSQVAAKIIVALNDSVIVGHNVNFDKGFIEKEFLRCGLKLPNLYFIDTLEIARKFGNFQNNKLGNIARQLEISHENWHRALSDVEMTSKIFEHFMIIFKKDGVITIRDLLKKIKKTSY